MIDKGLKWIAAMWNKVPAPVQKWIKGAEVAVVTAVVAVCVTAPSTDFSSKESIAKFAAGVAAAAYGAIRLYMAQSPIQNVLQQVDSSEKLTAGGLTLETKSSQTLSGPSSANAIHLTTDKIPGTVETPAGPEIPAAIDG